MVYRFEQFTVDTERFEVRHEDVLVHVEPKVFRLIAHLAGNADRVISMEELVEAVWDGRVVSDATVAGCIKHARKALADTGSEQRLIRTIRGRGFRFAGQVCIDEQPPAERSGAPDRMSGTDSSHAHHGALRHQPGDRQIARPPAKDTPDLTDPSLLVMPFHCLADSPHCRILAAQIAGNLGRLLSRIPLLRISAQTYAPLVDAADDRLQGLSVQAIREQHGVDYIIEGSLRSSDGVMVVDARLSDARHGYSVWAETFRFPDGASTTLEKTVMSIVSHAEPKLARAIYDSVRSRDGTPNARSLYLEANGLLSLKGWHYQSFPVARDLLRQSWQLSPDFAHAPGFLSFVLGLGNCLGILDERERNHDEALQAAENALMLDSQESSVLSLAGCALADLGYPGRALPILQHAVELNTSNAQAWAALGSVCISQRRLDAAVDNLRHGMDISPMDTRLAFWGSVLSTALRLHGRYDEARQEAELACRREYSAYWSRVALAAAHHRLGNRPQALDALHDAYRAKPDLSVQQVRYLVGQKLARELLEMRQ